MKLKSTEKAALLVLFGIAVCALCIIYIAKPNFETRQSLEDECVQLQARLSDLQAKQADREKYEAGIVEYTEKYEDILDAFPADMNQEITIMFLEGIKDNNDFSIVSLGLGEKVPFYTMGTNGTDAVLGEDASSGTGTQAATEAGTTQAATTEATTTQAATTQAGTTQAAGGELVEGEEEPAPGQLICYSAEFPITYTGSYKSLKNVVDYIDNYSDRMTVDSLEITYTGDGIYTGDLALTCYSVEGEERPERSLELNQIEIGVDNIFEGGNGGKSSNDSSLNKYDDKDGAEIEVSYDFYAMLNPSTSDVSAKVIGQNGNGKEKTVITKNDNTVSSLSYDIYETDGKIYCKYTLDGNQTYEAEVVSADDIKLLIQSSARKNDDDKVGVKITINNSTSMPVYVKVSGDDAVSPRVTVTKTGSVKVYQ